MSISAENLNLLIDISALVIYTIEQLFLLMLFSYHASDKNSQEPKQQALSTEPNYHLRNQGTEKSHM